jgi:FkbM family methyltransferase
MNPLLRSIAVHTGYYILPRWRLPTWDLSTHLATLFQQYQVDGVLDVGANHGQFHHFLRHEVRFRGWIVSFDAVSAAIADLRQQVRTDPKWVVYGCALGRAAGVMPMHVMSMDVFSSFREPNHQVVPHLAERNTVHHVEHVSVRTLADVWPEIQKRCDITRPYLKLDTQGFDLEVLAGAGDALAAFNAAQTELSVRPIYQGAPEYIEALRVWADLGFAVTGFFPVARDPQLRLVEMDCTLVRCPKPEA